MYERLYRSLYRIRRVEEEIARAYPTDCIKSPVHLSIGQEAVSVGVCEALRPDDVVFGTYRGHALYLAKGGSMRRMVAELYGKATGCAAGKGGSMHLVAPEAGVMGMSAVVASTIPNAVGYAYALRYRQQFTPLASLGGDKGRGEGSPAIVASFFGDGATEEGVFFESLNFAALKKLPVLFVCENNQYAIHTHQSRRQGTLDICERAKAQGILAERIEDNDIIALYQRSAEIATKLRNGDGPHFLEVMTYRWHEHVGPGHDYQLGFRAADDAKPWMDNDQVRRLAALAQPDRRAEIEAEAEAEIADAFRFAIESPEPEVEQLLTDVFKEEGLACSSI